MMFKKCCRHWKVIGVNSSSFNLIQLVDENLTMLEPGTKVLLTPEVPCVHWASLLLAPTRPGRVWWWVVHADKLQWQRGCILTAGEAIPCQTPRSLRGQTCHSWCISIYKEWTIHVCPIIQQTLMMVSFYTNSIKIVSCISWLLTNMLFFLSRNNLENTLKYAIDFFLFMSSDYKEIAMFSKPELREKKNFLSNESVLFVLSIAASVRAVG